MAHGVCMYSLYITRSMMAVTAAAAERLITIFFLLSPVQWQILFYHIPQFI